MNQSTTWAPMRAASTVLSLRARARKCFELGEYSTPAFANRHWKLLDNLWTLAARREMAVEVNEIGMDGKRPLPEPCRFTVPCSEIGGSRCRPCFECCDRGDAR